MARIRDLANALDVIQTAKNYLLKCRTTVDLRLNRSTNLWRRI